jgi:hypothetical protein
MYLAPAGKVGEQVLKGVIYSDASGKPEALLGTTEQLTFKSTNTAGWYDLHFASPVKLAVGNYWIGVMTGATAGVTGFRYDNVAGARNYNANTYASGPTNPFGAVTADSEQMSLYATYAPSAPAGPPTSIKPPTISGTAQQGKTLSEAHGEWTSEPTSFAYQWLQCDGGGNNCKAISGATTQTYVPVPGDVGHTLRVQETATGEGGSSSPASSIATAVVTPLAPPNTAVPTITGTAQQGQTLTEHSGTWEGEPTSFAYQWLQCDGSGNSCTAIAGATSQTYLLLGGDVGHTIRVAETATNAGGPSSPATSAGTAVVTPLPPSNELPPTITGTAQQNQTLTEVHGKWANNPTSFTYQWLACDGSGGNCKAIAGATNQTYVPVAADVGHTLKVQETATNAGGSSGPVTSSATSLVAPPAPVNKTVPTLTGTAQQGQTLTEHSGTWEGEPTSFAYQWLQCDGSGNNCKPISGAATQSYVLVAADAGHVIKVQETASNVSGTSNPAVSAGTAVVTPLPPSNELPPTITGTAKQGQTLTEVHGKWTNSPTSFSYQWLQCNSLGASCAPISGATTTSYVLAAADVGHTIAVQETATNAGGSGGPATSSATGVVQANKTFGKTTIGASQDTFASERKRVNSYALPEAGSVTTLTIYLAPTGKAGEQVLKGVIYSDASGKPEALLGATEQLTFKSTNTAGWYDLQFASPVKLAAGSYWIGVMTGATAGVTGFRYDNVAGARNYNANTYASGPTNSFGAVTTDSEQMSLYASY